MIARIGAVLAATALLAGCGSYGPTDQDRFQAACEDKGGFVSIVQHSFWSDTYGCIVNNQIVYLPGFD